MNDDQFRLKEKTDAELHAWLIDHKPGTDEYIAGLQESIRRFAVIEELIDHDEAPTRKREMIAIGIAIVSITIAIIAIVLSY